MDGEPFSSERPLPLQKVNWGTSAHGGWRQNQKWTDNSFPFCVTQRWEMLCFGIATPRITHQSPTKPVHWHCKTKLFQSYNLENQSGHIWKTGWHWGNQSWLPLSTYSGLKDILVRLIKISGTSNFWTAILLGKQRHPAAQQWLEWHKTSKLSGLMFVVCIVNQMPTPYILLDVQQQNLS